MPRTATPRKKTRDAEVSRARVFAAAAEEFTQYGFDGAKVDRIAERAGMNKAMLYYHFTDKAALYAEVVGDMFAGTSAALRALRDAGGPPEAQITGFVDVVAREGQARPHFPALWLRELADGGAHLGPRNFNDMLSIVSTLGEILNDGERAGTFRPMPAFMVQMGIVGPLFLFLATGPMRARLKARMPVAPPEISPEAFVEHVKRMTLGALTIDTPTVDRRTKRTTKARRTTQHS